MAQLAEVIDVRVAPNGRMVLPRSVREALGVTGAGVVVPSVDGDEVRLTSIRQSLGRAGALSRPRHGRQIQQRRSGGAPSGGRARGFARRRRLIVARVVFDASAVIALLRDEPGAEVIAASLGEALISTVNLQEVGAGLPGPVRLRPFPLVDGEAQVFAPTGGGFA